MEIKVTETGIAVILPFQDNANYNNRSFREINKGYALDCLGSWNEYIRKMLGDHISKKEAMLAEHINKVVYANKDGYMVFSDGWKFRLATHDKWLLMQLTLENESHTTFLRNFARETLNILILSRDRVHPAELGGFTLEDLVCVLQAAEHNEIEGI